MDQGVREHHDFHDVAAAGTTNADTPAIGELCDSCERRGRTGNTFAYVLFATERDKGVNLRGAAGGSVAGERRSQDQN